MNKEEGWRRSSGRSSGDGSGVGEGGLATDLEMRLGHGFGGEEREGKSCS